MRRELKGPGGTHIVRTLVEGLTLLLVTGLLTGVGVGLAVAGALDGLLTLP